MQLADLEQSVLALTGREFTIGAEAGSGVTREALVNGPPRGVDLA